MSDNSVEKIRLVETIFLNWGLDCSSPEHDALFKDLLRCSQDSLRKMGSLSSSIKVKPVSLWSG